MGFEYIVIEDDQAWRGVFKGLDWKGNTELGVASTSEDADVLIKRIESGEIKPGVILLDNNLLDIEVGKSIYQRIVQFRNKNEIKPIEMLVVAITGDSHASYGDTFYGKGTEDFSINGLIASINAKCEQ